MTYVRLTILLAICGIATLSIAQDQTSAMPSMQGGNMTMMMHHHGTSASTVTYEELTNTAAMLEVARLATNKYHDVHVAEADGYAAMGPDVPGMGIHFVKSQKDSVFDISHPQILLYEKDAAGNFNLVGVSYAISAAADANSQPLNPPFPKSLASWHRHEDVCVLADRSTPTGLNAEQCQAKGGHFIAETNWMVHAWIWKESPEGVFSPTNSTVH